MVRNGEIGTNITDKLSGYYSVSTGLIVGDVCYKTEFLDSSGKLYPEMRESMTVNDVVVLNIRNVSTIT